MEQYNICCSVDFVATLKIVLSKKKKIFFFKFVYRNDPLITSKALVNDKKLGIL